MIRNKLSLLVICAALATQGQVLCRWTADNSRTTPVEFSCFRGESLLLSPTLASYGTSITNYTATLLWQTNGMGTAWWSTNVLAFTPSMDVGASKYTIFIRAAMTNGVNYRANGTITMRNAPGYTPNTIPLPVPSIDFATVNTTNAPWLLAELDPGIPAAIATAVAIAGTNTTAAIVSKVSTTDTTYTQTVARAESALQPADTNGWIVSSHVGLVTSAMLEGYLPITGGTMGENATITLRDLYLSTVHSHDGVAISDGPFGHDITLNYPQDINGVFTFATREWAYPRNNPSNYITLAQVPAETDSIALGRLTTHTNRTDNPHAVTAAQIGATTPLDVTNAIAAASSANFIVNLSTNKLIGFTFEPTNATYYGDCSGGMLPAAGIVSVPIGTNGNYAIAWGCTNTTFSNIEGTYVNGVLYCSENEAGDMTAKVEIYRRDILANTMSEWGDGGAIFTVPSGATPQGVPFFIFVPSINTNQFRIWARVKRVGGAATSARLLIVGSGAGTPTHFSMTVPASVPIDAHNASASAHSNMIRTALLWSASGTNATYRMSWDVTNGTFKIEEILP
jgi:hypothetical protein